MDNNNGGSIVDGTRFFTAGAGNVDPFINTNPPEENLDIKDRELDDWLPGNNLPKTPTTPEIPAARDQEIGNAALSTTEESHEDSIQQTNNQSKLGEVVDIIMPPGVPSQENYEKNYPIEITKILEDNKLTGKEVKSLEKEIKELDVIDQANMLNDIWQGSAESGAA